MSVLDDLLNKKPERATAVVPLDPAKFEELQQAQHALVRARAAAARAPEDSDKAEVVDKAEERVEELLAAVDGQVATFVFEAVTTEEFDRLKGEHRPTESQRTEARKTKQGEPEWNPIGFQPALVALACVEVTTPSGTEPGLSSDTANAMWASKAWNTGAKNLLFNTALSAYFKVTSVDTEALGKG